jgi:hypothetical protein
MGSLRRSNDVVLAKIETTYNTDPVPVAGTNAILVYNDQLGNRRPAEWCSARRFAATSVTCRTSTAGSWQN